MSLHENPEIISPGATPQEAINAHGFVLWVRIYDNKTFRAVIMCMYNCGI